jgi:Rieske Fe-S protein
VNDVDYLISDHIGYKTGHRDRVGDAFRELLTEVEGVFPVASVDYRWDAHDYTSSDGIPYVGRMTGSTANIYVATGFGAWGMTNGTAAALMLGELILGRKPEWLRVFDSTRKDVGQLSGMISQVAESARFLVVPRVLKAHEKIEDIKPGEAKATQIGGEEVTVGRDQAGEPHAVKTTCRHLGCVVTWNDAEESWDCPCHGSRYSADGQMLNAPTTKDLTKVELT